MKVLIFISIGGILGSLLRYFVSNYFLLGPKGIFFCNVLGCFLIGITIELINRYDLISEEWNNFIIIGFLGSLTTFSSYSLNIYKMIGSNMLFNAFFYLSFTVLATLGALYIGVFLVRILSS